MEASSLEEPASPTSVDKIPRLPPRCPSQRSAQRWLIALEDLEYLSSSDDEEDDDDNDDDYSTSDSDSETTYSASDIDFDQYCSDSDSDDDESYILSNSGDRAHHSKRGGRDCGWGGKSVNAHEWTFPPNAILPNLQEVFREAALNQDVDINQRIKALAVGGFSHAG